MKKQQTKCVPCFKRWSRKGYAIFASLHREVKIGVLALTMATASLQGLAIGADTTRIERIETVSVIALRGSVAARSLSEPAATVDPLSLKYGAITSIEHALNLAPQFDIRSRGARGIQSDISIRGASPDQAMVLLNGVNFSDARTGHQSHSLPLPIGSIAAVDFINNTQSIGAFSGAIDYRTPPSNQNSLWAGIQGGEFGTFGANIAGSIAGRQNSLYLGASYDQSDGYTPNTDYRKLNVFLSATHSDSIFGRFDFQAGFQSMDFGSNGFYSLAYPDQWEATQTALGSLVWSKRIAKRLKLNALASYRLNTDHYELYRPGYATPPSSYKGGNYHLTDNVTASVWASYDWRKGGVTSLGVDYTYNHILSTVLGLASSPVRIGSIDYNKAKDRSAFSYYLRHTIDLGKVDLGASVSVNSTSDYGTTPLWSAMVGYDIISGLRAEFSATASMRLPSFTDLYYTTSTHVGNSDLAPEKATTFDLSLRYGKGEWSASASSYYRMGRDIIDWVRPVGVDIWHSEQITSLATFGVELSGAYRPERGVLQRIELNYSYVNTDKNAPGDYISKYALDYMRHKASLAIDIRIVKNLIFNVTGSYYERNGIYEVTAGQPSSYAPYFLLDSRLTWTIIKRIGIWAECSNILAQEHFDFGGILLPGRWFMAGVKVKIL